MITSSVPIQLETRALTVLLLRFKGWQAVAQIMAPRKHARRLVVAGLKEHVSSAVDAYLRALIGEDEH